MITIENGKIIFRDKANPDSNRHVEMYYENGKFKTVEVVSEERDLTSIDFNEQDN